MPAVNRYQDLSRFVADPAARGRPAWFVQLWWLFDAIFVRPTPQFLYGWRRFALILFGARIGKGVLIRPGVRVTYPWKLTIGDHVWIGDNATLYSVGQISIGSHSVISQEAYLCAGTHDYRYITFPFIGQPITIATECWIAARAFIGPGVEIGCGSVVGAGSVVTRSIDDGIVVAGAPAKTICDRESGLEERYISNLGR